MEYISEEKIILELLLQKAHHPHCGAVVMFSGDVRDNNIGKNVEYLEYESFKPMAIAMIEEILQTAKQKWDLKIAICTHRVGKVQIMESAVCVITSSAHRKEAYEANEYIMERVKHEVPIWKKEVYSDGSFEWGNNCGCHPQNAKPENHAKSVPLSFLSAK